jgi:hypothetical protein
LDVGKKLIVLIVVSAIFLVEGVFLFIGFLVQFIYACVIALTVLGFAFCHFYLRLYQKKAATYAVLPREGKKDIYFQEKTFPDRCMRIRRKMQESKKVEKNKKENESQKETIQLKRSSNPSSMLPRTVFSFS